MLYSVKAGPDILHADHAVVGVPSAGCPPAPALVVVVVPQLAALLLLVSTADCCRWWFPQLPCLQVWLGSMLQLAFFIWFAYMATTSKTLPGHPSQTRQHSPLTRLLAATQSRTFSCRL